MAVSLRKLGRTEAEEAFGKVLASDAQDPVLAMALKIVQQREGLRTRTLVAHLKEWGAAAMVRPKLTGTALDSVVWERALALLALEVELSKSANTDKSPVQRAQWTSDRLHQLLVDSANAIEEAKQQLATRIATGDGASAPQRVDHFAGRAA